MADARKIPMRDLVRILNDAPTWAAAGEVIGRSAKATQQLARKLAERGWPIAKRRSGPPRLYRSPEETPHDPQEADPDTDATADAKPDKA